MIIEGSLNTIADFSKSIEGLYFSHIEVQKALAKLSKPLLIIKDYDDSVLKSGKTYFEPDAFVGYMTDISLSGSGKLVGIPHFFSILDSENYKFSTLSFSGIGQRDIGSDLVYNFQFSFITLL